MSILKKLQNVAACVRLPVRLRADCSALATSSHASMTMQRSAAVAAEGTVELMGYSNSRNLDSEPTSVV